MKKRMISLLLILCMMTALMSPGIWAAEEQQGGACGVEGESLSWRLDEGVLTVVGEGKMADYAPTETPWHDAQEEITAIVIEGLENIGAYAFSDLKNAKSVTLPDGLEAIGESAFEAAGIEALEIPASVASIDPYAFRDCTALGEILFEGSAPQVGSGVFGGVTAKALYPADDMSWTEEYRAAFGENLTWEAYGDAPVDNGTDEESTESGEIFWELDENGVLTVSGSGNMPEWTEDDPLWFDSKDQIVKAVIEEGVTGIAAEAFASCTVLREVSLPASLESIAPRAFENCGNLLEITLPENVELIGSKAFCGCEALTEIGFEGAAPEIGAYAFGNVTADVYYIPTDRSWSGVASKDYGGVLTWHLTGEGDLEGYDIHWVIDRAGVLTVSGSGDIPDSDFNGTDAPWTWYDRGNGFHTVIIEEGVTGIGDYAFSYCQNIRCLSIPDGVTSIGDYAFFPYAPLEKLSIPATVKSIGECAFFASDMKTLELYEGLETIGEGAFCGCNYLESVVIPASVTHLDKDVFCDCYQLKEIRFEGPAPVIGKNTFSGVTATAYYPGGDATWTEDVMQNYGGTITWKAIRNIVASGKCGAGKADLAWALDDAGLLTVSGEGAMADRTLLNVPWRAYSKKILAVEIEEGVTDIGAYAFFKCTKLASVSLPSTLKTIGSYAFAHTALTSVTLPEKLVRLDAAAFADTDLAEIVIPPRVTTMGKGVFSGCERLREITFCGAAPAVCLGSLINVKVAAYYPEDAAGWKTSVMKYCGGRIIWRAYEDLAASGVCGDELIWKLNQKGVLTVSGRGEITDCAGFTSYKDQINTVIIEKGVTTIAPGAFASFKSLTSVELADSVKTIGSAAFKSCSALKSVRLPEGLTSVEASAFEGCSVLADIVLPTGLVEIKDRAFYGCRALTSVVFPRTLRELGSYAFSGCSKLAEMRFLGGPVEIGSYCFRSVYATVYYMPSEGWVTPDQSYGGSLYWAAIGEGDIGHSGVHWKVDESGLLTLSGRGAVPAYSLRYEEGGSYAPWKDYRVRSVFIASGITGIGSGAITCNSYLCNISVAEDNRYFRVVDQLLYNQKQTSLIACPAAAAGLESCKLPGGLKRIEDGVFAESSLKLVRIPESVEYVGAYAFYNCNNLWNIKLPAGVKRVENGAFAGCRGLVSVMIPAGVQTIGKMAFADCAITGVTLPSGVVCIESGAFGGCKDLASVVFPESLKSIDAFAFGNCTALGEIRFCGSAPEIGGDAFANVTSDAYYPANDDSWDDAKLDYGGTLNWIASAPTEE